MVIPLCRSRWRSARWLVLAPHPDDETLGVGALIAEAAADNRLAAIVYLTDGAASHPDGGRRLAALRRREARLAIHRLARRAVPIVHLDWPDAQPPPRGTRRFDDTSRRLAALLRRAQIDAIAVTAAHEPHCDHAAANALAHAAGVSACRAIAVFDYVVWAGPPSVAAAERYRTSGLAQGRRRWALRAHRSQLGPAFAEGFRLAEGRMRMPNRDILYRGRSDARR